MPEKRPKSSWWQGARQNGTARLLEIGNKFGPGSSLPYMKLNEVVDGKVRPRDDLAWDPSVAKWTGIFVQEAGGRKQEEVSGS